jgi:hypothetical protein
LFQRIIRQILVFGELFTQAKLFLEQTVIGTLEQINRFKLNKQVDENNIEINT